MRQKITKIIVLLFLVVSLLVGLLSIFRATIPTSSLTVISDKVIDKKILYFISAKSGRHYCLAFQLEKRQGKIAINLGTKSQADKDSAFYLIDIGKTYTFYLDPTIPTSDGINWGIDKIDYNSKEVYKKSNKLNLYGGTSISLLCLAGIIVVLKSKKR